MASIPEKVFAWMQGNVIVEVKDFDHMPFYVKHAIGHIHTNGVCVKNRYGPRCGVDTDPAN